jgi:hypothetical protein
MKDYNIRQQGSPYEQTVHFDDTDSRRVRLGLTDKIQPLCRNGSFHIHFTHDRKKVTCPACLEKMK